MERVLTQEERIRRAEEIYLRRRNIQQPQYRVQSNIDKSIDKPTPVKTMKLFKRVALQIVICLLLYCIFYLIYDTDFSFSNATINKTAEILNYDINIEEMYKNASGYINGLIHNNEKEEIQETTENNQVNEQTEDTNQASTQEQPQEANQVTEEIPTEQVTQQEQTVEQTEQTSTEAVDLKQLYSLVRPIQSGGYVSSEFGDRESTSEIVSTNHKGIDIAATTRNKYCSSNWRSSNNCYHL